MESDTNVPVKVNPFLGCRKPPSQLGVKLGSRAKAINEYCKECIYDEHSGLGTWRQQTEACPMTKCPLYQFRPTSTVSKEE